MEQAVLVSPAVAHPSGDFEGLVLLSVPQLGAKGIAEVVVRAGVEPESVDPMMMSNVVQAWLGQNPARQEAWTADLMFVLRQ